MNWNLFLDGIQKKIPVNDGDLSIISKPYLFSFAVMPHDFVVLIQSLIGLRIQIGSFDHG